MSERIIEVAAGVLVDDAGRVLLCQRGYGAQQGLWEFPGGKREAGESFAACLEREIGEELGMRVTCEREMLRMRYAYPERTIDFCFLLARTHGQTPVLTEHTGAVWLAFDAIGGQRLCPADAKAYDMLRKMSKYDG